MTDVKPMHLLAALGLVTAAAFLLSLSIGPAGLGINATGEARALIFQEIRLPRAVLGALVGAALGLSGAALQGYLRNPLAEPSLVGVSGGDQLRLAQDVPNRRPHRPGQTGRHQVLSKMLTGNRGHANSIIGLLGHRSW